MGSKGDQTREMIIQQAASIFNRYGYAGTSMTDIMRETGLEKGGIYNHFPGGKDELALAAFDYTRAVISQRLRTEFQYTRHALDRLKVVSMYFHSYLDDAALPGGCPIMNTAIEMDDADHPALKARAQLAMTEMLQTVERIIIKGITRGEIRPTVDARDTASVILSLLEGALALSRLFGERHHLAAAAAHIEAIIETQLRP